MISDPTTPEVKFCQFCPHNAHGTERCPKCRCKGKQRWWQKAGDGVGEAIGQILFGGQQR